MDERKGSVMANPAALLDKAGVFFVLLVVVPVLAFYGPLWYGFAALGVILALRESMWLPRKKWGGNIEQADNLGFVAVCGLIAMVVVRREHGFGGVMVVLAGVAGTDTLANIVGALIGKHHYSKVSKNKTIEGLIGGAIGGSAMMWLAWLILNSLDRLDMSGALLAVGMPVVVGFSVWGDHFASKVKRGLGDASTDGIKNFSSLFGKATGGFLDRFDSHIFAFTAFALLDLRFWFEVVF